MLYHITSEQMMSERLKRLLNTGRSHFTLNEGMVRPANTWPCPGHHLLFDLDQRRQPAPAKCHLCLDKLDVVVRPESIGCSGEVIYEVLGRLSGIRMKWGSHTRDPLKHKMSYQAWGGCVKAF